MRKKRSNKVDDGWSDTSNVKKQELMKTNQRIAKSYLLEKFKEDLFFDKTLKWPEWKAEYYRKKEEDKLREKRERRSGSLKRRGISTRGEQSDILEMLDIEAQSYGDDGVISDKEYAKLEKVWKKEEKARLERTPIHHLCFHYRCGLKDGKPYEGCYYFMPDPSVCNQMCSNWITWYVDEIYNKIKKRFKAPASWFDVSRFVSFTYKQRKKINGERVTVEYETTDQIQSGLGAYNDIVEYEEEMVKMPTLRASNELF